MSKICVLLPEEAAEYEQTKQLPNCRYHRHVSQKVAEQRVGTVAAWLDADQTVIVQWPTEPWRWQPRRSGHDGPTVMQLLR